MPDPFTTIPTVLKWTSKICSPLLRFYYTSQKLDPFLLLDIPSTGDAVSYYFSSQEARCYLTATNLSPFDFTVDRINLEVVIDGGSFSCASTMPFLIKGSSRGQIFAQSKSPMTSDIWNFAKNSKQASVNIDAYIVTSIRSFQIRRYITDLKNIRVIA
jgi:hypothetical protein